MDCHPVLSDLAVLAPIQLERVYLFSLFISFVLSAGMALYVLAVRRKTRHSEGFLAILVLAALWTLGALGEGMASDLAGKLFWARLQYIPYCLIPPAILFFALQITGGSSRFPRLRHLLIVVLPTAGLILALTNRWHQLVRRNEHLASLGGVVYIAKEYGSAFYLIAVYSYLLMAIAFGCVLRAAFIRKTIPRRQGYVILITLGIEYLSSGLYSFFLNTVWPLDITPALVGPSWLLIFYFVFRDRLFDLRPLARDQVLESTDYGILILDTERRVVDANPSAGVFLGKSQRELYLQPLNALLPFPVAFDLSVSSPFRHFWWTEHPPRALELVVEPLHDRYQFTLGYLAMIRDITAAKEAEEANLRQQALLAAARERETLARDLHDNLGQVLGYISLEAQGVERRLASSGDSESAAHLTRIAEGSREAHNQIRAYLQAIRGDERSRQPLCDALRLIAAQTEAIYGIHVRTMLPPQPEAANLPSIVRNAILNIVREALGNSARHSGVRQAHLRLYWDQETLNIEVDDDGVGFDPRSAQAGRSYGLRIMRERSDEIGALLKIESEPGHGTRMVLRIPADTIVGHTGVCNA